MSSIQQQTKSMQRVVVRSYRKSFCPTSAVPQLDHLTIARMLTL
jgi:hypothetical protein